MYVSPGGALIRNTYPFAFLLSVNTSIVEVDDPNLIDLGLHTRPSQHWESTWLYCSLVAQHGCLRAFRVLLVLSPLLVSKIFIAATNRWWCYNGQYEECGLQYKDIISPKERSQQATALHREVYFSCTALNSVFAPITLIYIIPHSLHAQKNTCSTQL